MRRKICVVGAGVIGISSAVCIQESCPGDDVTVMADRFTPNTTSDGSGGFWEPHIAGDTDQKLIRNWGQDTFDHLLDLVKSSHAGELGAQLVSGYHLCDGDYKLPDWRDQVIGFRQLTANEINSMFPTVKSGAFFTTIMIDVKSYLPWLMKRFKSKGGHILKRKVNSLHELALEFDVIVNCSGVWANTLVGDRKVQPVRGQTIKVHAPWVKHFIVSFNREELEAYILPGSRSVVLGGTAQQGNWDETPSDDDKRHIWERCLKLIPSLQYAQHDHDFAGLRPARTEVRLEEEEIKRGTRSVTVVHNYGHGGCGVTLHWGCAKEAAKLVKAASNRWHPAAKL